ncbi:hypothetical protein [Actinacidiphila yanglinensis]|uniref:hypothetical protein n=1 Tax=Actinacidiphila yanglinensis TaxID=310779 RepID=UPI0011B06EC5|nr:hypothetical protein [Actinacidiphila yanglinensis]
MDQNPPQTTTTGTPSRTTTTPPATTAMPSPLSRAACGRCGATAEGLPLTWICSVENGRRVHFCDACARKHLRSIEGRLDSAWW